MLRLSQQTEERSKRTCVLTNKSLISVWARYGYHMLMRAMLHSPVMRMRPMLQLGRATKEPLKIRLVRKCMPSETRVLTDASGYAMLMQAML